MAQIEKPEKTEMVNQPGEESLATFDEIISKVPEAGDEAFDRILTQVFNAKSANELDAAWKTDSFSKLSGHEILVTDIKQMPSDYTGGLGYYLIVAFTDKETGEECVGTTGSVAIVAQLVKAFVLGALPLSARVIVAERASRNGYHPMHLQIVRGLGPR